MANYDNMTDEELNAAIATAQTPVVTGGYDGVSDDELNNMIANAQASQSQPPSNFNVDYTTSPAQTTTDIANAESLPGQEQVNIIPTPDDIEQQRAETTTSLSTQELEMMNDEQRAKYEKTHNVPGQNLVPGSQALESSLLDPTLLTLEEGIAKGVIAGASKVIDKVQWPSGIKKIFSSMDAAEYETQQNLYEFMSKQGINPTDALIEGSKGSDIGAYLSGHNVFAVREAFEGQQKLADDYISMTNSILGNLKSEGINVNDISTWRHVKKAEDIIATEVTKLRESYKKIENDLYGEVSKVAKGNKNEYRIDDFTNNLGQRLVDEGIPNESMHAVNTILNRFTKPYKADTKALAKANAKFAKIRVEQNQLKRQQDIAEKSGDLEKAGVIRQKRDALKISRKEAQDDINSLKDVRYMTTEDLLNTSKLLNRKIYKPGGSISVKDADELRGLQIAKQEIDDYLFNSVKDPALKEALGKAREVTKTRAGLFGAKDTGGEKLMLAKMLDQGEYGKVTEYITGPQAKENILYIRDTFGKDSEAYRSSLSLYITDKLGFTAEGLQSILAQNKATGVMGKVDIQKAAAKISKLDGQDFAMVENVLGKQSRLDLQAVQKLATNYADMELASEKYGKGITGGMRNYIFGGEATGSSISRGLTVVKDAVGYYIAKTAEKVVYNQPKFRAVTGAATGATVYFANAEPEDISLEGLLMSMATGSAAGYYAGKGARSLLETDANKVARYLKAGKGKPDNMPQDIEKALSRLGQATGGSKRKSFGDEYDSMPLPGKEDIGKGIQKFEQGLEDDMGKLAGGGRPPESSIDFRYKLNDTLEKLPPQQKFSAEQLEGYLKKNGVSPKEIKQSGLFDNPGASVRKIEDWAMELETSGRNKIGGIDGNLDYTDITLGGKGQGTNAEYRETLSTIEEPIDSAPQMSHFVNEIEEDNLASTLHPERIRYANQELKVIDELIAKPNTSDEDLFRLVGEKKRIKLELKDGMVNKKPNTLLGWRRTHQDTINGKPTTVLNEFQSDWAQTERSGRGTFVSSTSKDLEKANAIVKKYKGDMSEHDWHMYMIEDTPEELNSALRVLNESKTNANNIVADFPMSEKKHHQYQIVGALDEAIQNGTNRVAIPIQRENELAGSEGVTKFYDSLNKSILPEIRKKLEKQGMKIKISKEDYSTKASYESEQAIIDIENQIDDIDWGDVNAHEIEMELLERMEAIQTNSKGGNTLHVLEIVEMPGKKVKWDVYSVLGAIGLGGLADKLKGEKDGTQ